MSYIYGVAGLMGNLYAESNLMPNNLQNTYNTSLGMSDTEYTTAVDNGSYTNFVYDEAGYGLAQWTYYSRKQNLLNYKKSKGVSIADITMQVEFLLIELKSDFLSVYNTLKTATDILTPSNKVLYDFENPASASTKESERELYGKEMYNLYSGSSISFTPRLTEPSIDNEYYIHTSHGGLNECIIRDSTTGSVLPNCVGYAWGRAYEILHERPTLSKNNAERWYGEEAEGYTRSHIPRVASIICWSKGIVGDSSDGAGHVAVVEEVYEDGSILTSNSDYSGTKANGRYFYMKTIPNTYELSGFTFQGFIYLPINVSPDLPVTPSNKKKKKFNFLLFKKKRWII